jgi:hypothetical protein
MITPAFKFVFREDVSDGGDVSGMDESRIPAIRTRAALSCPSAE